jgi:hypothetical protein
MLSGPRNGSKDRQDRTVELAGIIRVRKVAPVCYDYSPRIGHGLGEELSRFVARSSLVLALDDEGRTRDLGQSLARRRLKGDCRVRPTIIGMQMHVDQGQIRVRYGYPPMWYV